MGWHVGWKGSGCISQFCAPGKVDQILSVCLSLTDALIFTFGIIDPFENLLKVLHFPSTFLEMHSTHKAQICHSKFFEGVSDPCASSGHYRSQTPKNLIFLINFHKEMATAVSGR